MTVELSKEDTDRLYYMSWGYRIAIPSIICQILAVAMILSQSADHIIAAQVGLLGWSSILLIFVSQRPKPPVWKRLLIIIGVMIPVTCIILTFFYRKFAAKDLMEHGYKVGLFTAKPG